VGKSGRAAVRAGAGELGAVSRFRAAN